VAIYIYNEGDREDGWIGIRVARVIGADDYRQEYLSFRDESGRPLSATRRKSVLRRAKAIDKSLKELQSIAANERRQRAAPINQKPELNTGVAGISAVLRKRSAINAEGKRVWYWFPMFAIQCSHKGKVFQTTCGMTRSGAKPAWEKACRKLAKYKDIDPEPLIARLKNPERLRKRLLKLRPDG
jgi:hypothetical protein